MTSPPTSLRPTGFLPTGTLAVGGGLLVLGASAYGFLAVSARTLGPERFAPLSVLWVIVYTAGPGLFLPLEQETGRALSARRVQRLGGRPVLLRTAAIGLVVVAVVSAATLAAAPAIVRPLFDGNSAMVAGLLLSLVGLWAAHVSRGALAGTGRFGRYGAQLALEGGLRLVGSVLFAVLAVRSSAPFALLVGAAPGLAVLLVVRSPRGVGRAGTAGPVVGDLRRARAAAHRLTARPRPGQRRTGAGETAGHRCRASRRGGGGLGSRGWRARRRDRARRRPVPPSRAGVSRWRDRGHVRRTGQGEAEQVGSAEGETGTEEGAHHLRPDQQGARAAEPPERRYQPAH